MSSVDVRVNKVGGPLGTENKLNWFAFDETEGTLPTFTAEMTDTIDLQAKGHIDLNLLGFLDGEADFEFFKGDAALNLPDGQPDLSSAALFAMGLDELDLTLGDPDGPHFAITGGSLARDAQAEDAADPARDRHAELAGDHGQRRGGDLRGVST